MTELKVEKKRKFPVLWTILAIIAVAVIIWIVVDDNDDLYEEDLTMTRDADSYDVESGYVEAEEWNGNPLDPWAGDTVWGDAEAWGDDSDADVDTDDFENSMDNEDDNSFGGDYSGAVGTDVTAPDETEKLRRVEDFVTFTENLENDDLNRRTAHEGLSKLAMALTSITQNEENISDSDEMQADSAMGNSQTTIQDRNTSGVQNELAQLRQQIDQLKDERMTGMQANIIRSTFMDAATVFQKLQSQHFPALQQEASDVMNAAQEINAEDMASNQKAEIKDFFDEAADAIQKARELTLTASSQ